MKKKGEAGRNMRNTNNYVVKIRENTRVDTLVVGINKKTAFCKAVPALGGESEIQSYSYFKCPVVCIHIFTGIHF